MNPRLLLLKIARSLSFNSFGQYSLKKHLSQSGFVLLQIYLTRRMAGGGADHHRPENVEQTHEVYTSFRFAAPGTPFADKRTDFL